MKAKQASVLGNVQMLVDIAQEQLMEQRRTNTLLEQLVARSTSER